MTLITKFLKVYSLPHLPSLLAGDAAFFFLTCSHHSAATNTCISSSLIPPLPPLPVMSHKLTNQKVKRKQASIKDKGTPLVKAIMEPHFYHTL